MRIPRAAEDKEGVKERLRQHFSDQTAVRWLLVIDSADDMQVLFGTGSSNGGVDFLPKNDDGVTVFTSRRQKVAESLMGISLIEVGKISKEEAVAFSTASLRKESKDGIKIKQLLAEFDYLPVAIA